MAVVVGAMTLASDARAQPALILATTTSTQDSGLLDVLLPRFSADSGLQVKPIAVGTGQALALGARGEADVLLVHAPEAECQWMAQGHGADRRVVMHNDFVIIGPNNDPAEVTGSPDIAEAMRRISGGQAPWLSRGDNSGTHILERQLWREAAIDPAGSAWYQEVGQGMGQTLTIANDKQGYTLTDRGTFLSRSATLDMRVVVEGFPKLLNVYHVITVNPAKGAHINAAGATAFADWIVAEHAQAMISTYGVDRFGQPLFFADAGRTDLVAPCP
jgi:tungstate transport system substrate-binding protein